MTHRKALFGSTALLLATTGLASADVTAMQVWENMSAFYSASGYELTPGTLDDTGGTVTITDLSVGFPNPYADLQDEIEIDMSATIASMVFEEMGDGTVNVTTSDTYQMVVTIAPSDEETGTIGMSIDQTGTTVVASGEPDMVTYTIVSPTIVATLDTIDVPGEEELAEAFDATITVSDMAATYTIGTGDATTLVMELTADTMGAVVAASEPGGEGSFDANVGVTAMTWSSNSNLAQGETPGDMTSMLKAGMTSDTQMSHGGSTYSITFSDDRDQFALQGAAASGSADVSMGDGVMSYLIGNTGMTVTMSGSEIPLPEIAFNAAATAFGITLPVLASEEAKDTGLTLRLEDLSVSDMIWGLLDPSGQLPRDPATLILELAGKANVAFDIMDPMAMAGFRGGLPGGVEAMDLKALELTVGGASLTGNGGFTFDMADMMSYDGVPAPTGSVAFQLVGANALMDKLVAMGLLPQEQAMGARMMMGMFARPGDGEDTLVSTIELDGEGAISANGQRLR